MIRYLFSAVTACILFLTGCEGINSYIEEQTTLPSSQAKVYANSFDVVYKCALAAVKDQQWEIVKTSVDKGLITAKTPDSYFSAPHIIYVSLIKEPDGKISVFFDTSDDRIDVSASSTEKRKLEKPFFKALDRYIEE